MSDDMRGNAEFLWTLLDDISTAGDAFKPDLKDPFVNYVLRKCEEKNDIFRSDGVNIYTIEESRNLKSPAVHSGGS